MAIVVAVVVFVVAVATMVIVIFVIVTVSVTAATIVMELDVSPADDALRPELGHCTSHRDSELIALAGLTVVFHRHAEGAAR